MNGKQAKGIRLRGVANPLQLAEADHNHAKLLAKEALTPGKLEPKQRPWK